MKRLGINVLILCVSITFNSCLEIPPNECGDCCATITILNETGCPSGGEFLFTAVLTQIDGNYDGNLINFPASLEEGVFEFNADLLPGTFLVEIRRSDGGFDCFPNNVIADHTYTFNSTCDTKIISVLVE